MPDIKNNILLLNPPGKQKYLRDYYCNYVSKGNYIYYPLDLLFISGTLTESKYKVSVLDALIKNLSPDETIEKIKELKPEFLVSMTGNLSWNEDISLFKKLKLIQPDIKIICTGNIFLENGFKIIKENSFLDACLLDFSDNTILKLIDKLCSIQEKGSNNEPVDNCIYRSAPDNIIEGKVVRKKGEFSIPRPRHEYFPIKDYKYAFSVDFPTAHILTDFGCAFNCTFCQTRFDDLGFKIRPVEDVIEELKYLKSMGVKELYIKDHTFGTNKKRAIELCERMIKENLMFSWHCFSRVDIISNEELLNIMKKSGCHTIILGVESANEEIVNSTLKKINLDQVKKAFELCKKKRIRRVGTFILGFPGETEEDMKKTVDLAIELDCSFASFNIAGIRPGSEWGNHPEKIKLLPDETLEKIRDYAVKRFYLRPSYFINRLLEVNTIYGFYVLFEEGIGVLKNFLRSRFKIKQVVS